MRSRWGVLVVAVTLASTAFATAAAAQSDDAEPGAPTTPTVRLLDAGDAPLAPLRFTVTPGAVVTGTMTQDQTIEQRDAESFGATDVLPTIELGLAMSVVDVLPDGTFTTTFGYPTVEATGDGSAASADQARQIEILLTDLTELTGEATTTSRGLVIEGGYDIPEDLAEPIKQVLEQLESQLQGITPPFPEEQVGPGARWRVTTRLDLSGIEAEQRYDYSLESVTGTTVELAVKIRQTARPQRFDPPGAAAGDVYRLLSLRMRGKGTVTLDLAKPLPNVAEITAHAVQKTRVRQDDDETEEFTVTIDQQVVLEAA